MKPRYKRTQIPPFDFGSRASNFFGREIPIPYALMQVKAQNDTWLPFVFIIDSGADMIMMPASSCDGLGINLKSGQPKTVEAVGGSIDAFAHTCKVKIGEFQFETQIGFSDECRSFLMGRTPVFDKFEITLKQQKKKTYFVSVS